MSAGGQTETIVVGVADDDLLTRIALATILEQFDDIHIAWAKEGGQEVLEALEQDQDSVDVVLLDAHMPGLGGVETCEMIKNLRADLPVIILTTFTPDEYLSQALRAGVSGFLVKDDAPEVVADAIRSVHHGAIVFSASVASTLEYKGPEPDPANHADQGLQPNPLTSKEMDVLRLVAESLTNQQIAKRLAIAEPTVKSHVSAILAKLDCTDRVGMVIWGYQNGVLGR
ncbi:MAG: response regulator transcription factor [Propionibacteriaceae bacterium]|nr:response regulator transcription factor [Propionibacteriaceae bacterium]